MGRITAEEYYQKITSEYTENKDMKEFAEDNKFQRFKMLIKKYDHEYQGEIRPRYTAIKVFKDSVDKENTHLLKVLQRYHEAGDF